jgi:hypothetical protein
MEAFGNVGATLPKADIPRRRRLVDQGKKQAPGVMEAVECGECRSGPATMPGAQFLDSDSQRLIFSFEFIAQMAIADYRRDLS